MNSLDRLSTLLATLHTKAKQTDITNQNIKSHRLIENNNLFSTGLFISQSDRFLPYVEEVQHRLTKLSRLLSTNKTDLSILLLQQIEQQITAISTALNANITMHQAAKLSFHAFKKVKIKKANVKQEESNKKLAKNIMLSSHQLYQKLSEHHEFERRLMDMVAERELQRMKSSAKNSTKISAEVLALHQRLGRCRRAISAIERDIKHSEKIR